MCPNLILLHPVVSAQTSSSYHLIDLQLLCSHSPAKANLQPGRIARERAWGRRGWTQHNPPYPTLPIPSATPLDRVVITFYVRNKSILQELGNAEYHSPHFVWLKADCGEGCSMSMQDLASCPSMSCPFCRNKIFCGAGSAPIPLSGGRGQAEPGPGNKKSPPSIPLKTPMEPRFCTVS